MSVLTDDEIAKLKAHTKDYVDNYPDVPRLLAEGKLIRKAGWYEAVDQATWNAISKYISGVRLLKTTGKGQFKIRRPPSLALRKISAKL